MTPSPPAPCVCTTVRKAGRALMRHYEAAVAVTGVSITQFALLRALERGGPTALTELAETMVMERTSLYRTLEPLVRTGAVVTTASGRGRSKIAELTPHGRTLIAAVLPHWAKAQQTMVDRIGETQWSTMAKLLLTIPELLESDA